MADIIAIAILVLLVIVFVAMVKAEVDKNNAARYLALKGKKEHRRRQRTERL